jgi:hypothetical protein
MARAVTVGPVVLGFRRIVLSSCSSHLRMTLSLDLAVPQVSMGQAGPFAAFAEGAVSVTAVRVAATRAATTSTVVASFCFTRFSLSAVRRTSTATNPDTAWAGGLALDLLRLGKRVTGFEERQQCRHPHPNGDHHEVQVRTPTQESTTRARGSANPLVDALIVRPGCMRRSGQAGPIRR